jgi:GTPase
MSLPVVAIVGRPNVGKSTLFNRIIGSRQAVVHDEPGITRDRLAARAEWNGVAFELVDTGGWIPEARDKMDGAVLTQVLRALDACDLVLFMADVRAGLHPHDQTIARELFRSQLPAVLVLNKTDSTKLEGDAAEFQSLGFSESWMISANEGRGIGELLDALVAHLPSQPTQPRTDDSIRVAILGRPNVGKSSLVNRLLGEERMIVDSVPGTTRDAVASPLRVQGKALTLIDTAGIRRHLDSQPSWEFYATLRALRALNRADVALLVLDATEPLNRQDARIADLIQQAASGVVIIMNKWDAVEKDNSTTGVFVQKIRETIPFFSYAPMEFVSALSAQRIHRIAESILRVYEAYKRETPTSQWNEILTRATAVNPPSSYRGQRPAKIYYATQVRTGPPTLALFVSDPHRVQPEYLRYLTARFREGIDLPGCPLRILLRKSK